MPLLMDLQIRLGHPQKCPFTLGFCMLNFSIAERPWPASTP